MASAVRRDDALEAHLAANRDRRMNDYKAFLSIPSVSALPIHAPHLLKGLVRQDSAVSRCQLRGGVHLEQSYVNDVCLSPRFNQCVFYEEDLSQR